MGLVEELGEAPSDFGQDRRHGEGHGHGQELPDGHGEA